MKTRLSEHGAVDLLLVILMVAVLGVGGYAYWHYQQAAKGEVVTNDNVPKKIDPTASWATYSSKTEKATFKYPKTWKQTTGEISNEQTADSLTLVSPSGSVKVYWISLLDGLGGSCDSTIAPGKGGCPLVHVLSSTALGKAPGLVVETGTITSDGQKYQPWIAVQDTASMLTTGPAMGYDLFTGRHNSKNLPGYNGNNTTAVFATSPTYASGPSLSQADANAYFNKPEVVEAKEILASLAY